MPEFRGILKHCFGSDSWILL